MPITYRKAAASDVPLLASMNQRLIRDEGHRNPMSIDQLEQRMRGWLQGEYEAVVISQDDADVGYALFRREADFIYLRQLFVEHDNRRQGIARAAVDHLITHAWHGMQRVRIEVLCGNADGIAFWKSLGFAEYCITMELETSGGDA